jgi:hypothetical protein
MLPKKPPKIAPDATAVRKATPPTVKAPPMDEMSMRFGGGGSGGAPGPTNSGQNEITKGYGMTPQDATFPEVNPVKRWRSTPRPK